MWSHYNIAEHESGQTVNKKKVKYVQKLEKVRTGNITLSRIGPKMWNSLSESMKESYTLYSFKENTVRILSVELT